MTDLGTLGGSGSIAYGINNNSEVTGYSYTTEDTWRAFRYNGTPGAGGEMADLGTLGGAYSEGRAINDSGLVAGWAFTSEGPNHAFLYNGTPGSGGVMVDLGTLGGTSSVGSAINNAGQVAGYSFTAGDPVYHAFLYSGTPGSGGAMINLGTLGGRTSYAHGINDLGIVVGSAERVDGASVATLWQIDPGNSAVDLDTWLDVTNPTQGAFWTLSFALDINDNGLITGWGAYNDGPGGLSDGTRAYILDASSLVPEPTGLALLAVGALGLLRRRRNGNAR